MQSTFTFLRRSFLRDVAGRDMSIEIPRLLAALSTAFQKDSDALQRDHQELVAVVGRMDQQDLQA